MTLGGGLLDQLEAFLAHHPETRLMIVDTLQKIREIGSDKYNYANDYEIVGRLKAFSDSIISACSSSTTRARWNPRTALT